MSKQTTLTTCIAKMYEGGKLDNAGVSGAGPTVKKPASTVINNRSGLEIKLNLLDAKVERVDNSQAVILKKMDMVFQSMGSMERDLAALKQARDSPEAVVGARGGDLGSLSEIRALCSEMVALLHSLRQEGMKQQEKLTGIESSVSTIDKVLGYVSDTFKSSKIVEYILRGIVPWRKGSLLDSGDDEKKSEQQTTKTKVKFSNQETQTLHGVNNAAEGAIHAAEVTPRQTLQTKIHVPVTATPDSTPSPQNHSPLDISVVQLDTPCPTSNDTENKGLRRPKEVTLQSREPTRTQTFTKDAQDTGVCSEDLDGAELEQAKAQAQETRTCGETAAGEPEAAAVEKPEVEHQETENTEPERRESILVPTLPIQHHREEQPDKHQDVQQKEDLLPTLIPHQCSATATQQNKDSTKPTCLPKPKSQAGPDQRPSQTESVLSLSQNKQSLPGPCDSTQPKPVGSLEMGESSQDSKKIPGQEVTVCGNQTNSSSGATVLPLVIDDCPPLPAPFEHRIVSAKQVPLGTYYAVKPNELLGGGRFGQVHKCAELSSGLTLAAKIIKVKGLKDREEVKNEIGVMNQLNHVNLIQLYDAFESRTNLTLIMEYVDGGELFDRIIDENYMLTELDAIVFMRQICEGVQYLHQQYILHLDLKPENILCVNSTGNQIKIIDFGLARKYRPREKLKVNFGTPEFLAPEVVNYDFVSFPTDMWSVGVITYMLLSGLSPFLGDNDPETMNNILHCNWDFDAEAFESISEEAKDFISRLLIQEKCSRMSATGCMKHSWLNNLEEKAKMRRVRLKSQLHLQRYLAAHRQWKKHFLVVAAANRLKKFHQSHSVKPA
ncbi:myosin light chain kinase 3-like isoform X1 [Anguilla anguilla]|uniref:myosin light chain kinase 3-like isoform X1 n=1 Tax=Anguilla anguilla TaxID=7936 RepID=UPI0015B36B4C|nr:myosin light chain kinase 3-like isoform X1 [Anguilla anguilla]XP_035250950.1 myosin light chain kinase 3-like isoform X1 [Anguilla anguilla]